MGCLLWKGNIFKGVIHIIPNNKIHCICHSLSYLNDICKNFVTLLILIEGPVESSYIGIDTLRFTYTCLKNVKLNPNDICMYLFYRNSYIWVKNCLVGRKTSNKQTIKHILHTKDLNLNRNYKQRKMLTNKHTDKMVWSQLFLLWSIFEQNLKAV